MEATRVAVTTVIVMLLLCAPSGTAAQELTTINLGSPFDISPNMTAAGSIRGVTVTPAGAVLFAARGTVASGIYGLPRTLNGTNNVAKRLVGNGLGCSETPSRDMRMSPQAVLALSNRQALIANGMWGSDILLLSAQLNSDLYNASVTTLNTSKAVGSTCNFTESPQGPANGTNATVTQITPPDFVAYRLSTEQLFYTQKSYIISVQGSINTVWFGSYRRGTRGDESRSPVFRTNAVSNFPGQMVVEESTGSMYFPEQMGTIRRVDLSTGLSEVIAGAPQLPGGTWPPPSCESSDCNALTGFYILYVKGMAFYRLNNVPYLYFVDITAATLLRMNLQTNTVRAIAGQFLKPGREDGLMGTSRLSGGSQLAVSGDTLYIADGNLRAFKLSNTGPSVPDRQLCSLITHCNGRAWNVEGIPAIKCYCECRDGWIGEQCETRVSKPTLTESQTRSLSANDFTKSSETRELTASRARTKSDLITSTRYGDSSTLSKAISETKSLRLTDTREITKTYSRVIPPKPRPIIPEPVVKAAETTVVVTSVVTGVIANPTIAVQAGRATLLFRISGCDLLEEELDWVQNVLDTRLGEDRFGYYRSSVIGNLAVVFGVAALHAVAALAFGRLKGWSTLEAFSIFRFPSLNAFPVLLVLEGTVMSSFVLVIHAPATSDKVAGLIGIICALALLGAAVYYLRYKFRCGFTVAPHEEKDIARPKNIKEAAVRIIKYLLFEAGKWENTEDGYRKRFGGFFRDYRPGRHAFILGEFAMCIVAGILQSISPGKGPACTAIVISLALVYVGFFFSFVFFLPYLARLNTLLALAVSGLQAVSAVQLVLLILTDDPDWEAASQTFAMASIYVLAIDALISLLDLLKKISYFLYKKCFLREAWSSSSDESYEMPMLVGPIDNSHRMTLTFDPGAELSSLSGSRNNSFARLEVENTSFIQGPPRQQVDQPSTSSSSGEVRPPRGLMEHERMRMELEALLEGGAPAASGFTHTRHGSTPIPSLLLTGAGTPMGTVHHRSASSTGAVPNRGSSSSSSGQVRQSDLSNLSFSSLLAGLEPSGPVPPQPPARDSSGSNELLSSNNNSFSRRRQPTPAMPQVNSSESNGSFSSQSRQGSNMLLMPPSPQPHSTPSSGSNQGNTPGQGFRQQNSTSSSSLSEPGSIPPPYRRQTVEGKKHA